MKITATLTAILACSLIATAAPKTSGNAEPRLLLENIQTLARSMTDTADQLSMSSSRTGASDMQMRWLDDLKSDVNSIGRNLVLLDDHEGSLTPWESTTVNEITPLMRDIASLSDKAIATFNANRDHAWATGFPEQTDRIYQQAERVTRLVDAQLRLASVRGQEQRLESRLSGSQSE